MKADSVAALQTTAVEYLGDILDEARGHARSFGARQTRPAHLLHAVLGRPGALSILAGTGADPEAVQMRLRKLLRATAQKPISEKPPFDEPLEAALFSTQVRLQTAPEEFFGVSCDLCVLRQLFAVIDRHAERDEICGDALASFTMDCVEVEEIRQQEEEIDALLLEIGSAGTGEAPQVGPEEIPTTARARPEIGDPFLPYMREARGPVQTPPPEEARQAAPRPAQAQPGTSHLARDAAEVEKAVTRAFRSLTDDVAEGRIDPVIGRERELERIIRALMRRRKRSVILHGPAGVGKTAIAEGVAAALRASGAPEALASKTVYELSLSELVSGTRYRGDFEERMTKALERLRKEEAIVFIDEIHTVMGLGSGQTRGMDAPNMLKPALARGEVVVIGATTTEELAELRGDRAIMRRFELIEVCEPDLEEMKEILERAGWSYLDHHGLRPGAELFEAILETCEVRMPEQRFPDKAFDLLDRACVEAVQDGCAEVGPEHVRAAAEGAGILFPGPPDERALRRLKRARSRLSASGLDAEARAAIDPGLSLSILAPAALKGAQAWLLLGEGGAYDAALTALCEAIEARPVRFPRLRLCEPGAIDWLVGSSHLQGAGKTGALIEAIETGPGDLFVLEGIDKAPPAVIELLEQIVGRGEIRTGSGRIVSTKGLRFVLSAAPETRNAIGFGASAVDALPASLEKLNALSGLNVVPLAEAEPEGDAVDTLIAELADYLGAAGYEIDIDNALAARLKVNAPGWAGREGQVRDRVLAQLMSDLSRLPEHRAWRLEFREDADQGDAGGSPQLTLTVAIP